MIERIHSEREEAATASRGNDALSDALSDTLSDALSDTPHYNDAIAKNSSDASVKRAADLVVGATRIVALTGAGISTDSGIPDFRGPQGLWTKNPKAEKTSNIQHYINDPEVRAIAWQNRLHSPAWAAKPNAGHIALVTLEHSDRLHTLVTQNIDELHQAAGSDPNLVVEVHGTMRRAECWTCKQRWPMEMFIDRVRAGETDPHCLECGGIVKSATISFGQNLVEADLMRAFDSAASCDLLLCVGTSLAVRPINRMVSIAAESGVPVVIVNGEPTELDHLATVIVRGQIGEVLPVIVASP
jgi:NAD-dependent deacetylase